MPGSTIVIAPSSPIAERLHAFLSRRRETTEPVRVVVITADATAAVDQIRALHGACALGYVASARDEALAALRRGADEAMTWPPPGDDALADFFERVTLRASLRLAEDERRRSLGHAERLAALGTLVAGVAHEITNPLTALQLSVEAFRTTMRQQEVTGADARELSETVEEVAEAVECIAGVVRDLRTFARAEEEPEFAEIVEVHALIEQALRLVGRDISLSGHVERDYADDVPQLLLPPRRLTQVLVNVLVNAAHAMREISRPLHRVRISTRTDGGHVAIAIADTGPGIPPRVAHRIFDPFFTTKRAEMGTGLGLYISRSLVQQLGGDLVLDSSRGDGATFVILIPSPGERAARPTMESGTQLRPLQRTDRRTVLLIGPDEVALSGYLAALSPLHNVLVAAQSGEAISLLSSGSRPDVIISEADLDHDGAELRDWIARQHPELERRLIFVAKTAEGPAAGAGRAGRPVLTKPVSDQALLSAVRRVLEDELR